MAALRFGTDGVRGVAGVDLTQEFVTALGRAAAQVFGNKLPFVVGRDTRESGPALEAALVEGLMAEGADAELVGVLPTPGVAYLAQERGLPAAMISASHNPYEDNGVKLFAPGGLKLADEVERRIETELERFLVANGDDNGDRAESGADGAALSPDQQPRGSAAAATYMEHLISVLEGRRLDGLRVVLDCGHGASFEVAPEAFSRLGANVGLLNATPNGRNINDACGSTHPEELQAEVVATGAALGLAFDGDADRLIAVDEEGQLIDGDHILAIAAIDLDERGQLRNRCVVGTVMANLGFRHSMEQRGIKIIETQVGDRYVLEALEEHGLVLGGEQSGHIVFRDLATTGDGLLTGLLLADAMTRGARRLSELASVVTKYPQVLRNVRVADRSGLDDATTVWSEIRKIESELGTDGRVLVRPSGTEPVVRVMVEAMDHEVAVACAERVANRLVETLGAVTA